MPNQSQIDKFILDSAYNDGIAIGYDILERVNQAISAGTLKEDQPIEVLVNIDKIFQYDFCMRDKILAKIGSPLVMSSGNVLLSVGGGSICLMSGKNFIQSNNKIAKVFYALGFMCGTTGTVSSTMAVYCNKCGISKTGMLSDGFGTLFLKAGDQANRWGKRLEGNITPQPSRFSRFLPRQHSRKPLNTVVGHKGLSFVPTCQTEIPVMELIAIGGTIYTVYRTTRLGLHYSRKLYAFIKSNSKIKRDGSPSIRLVSEFFIETLQIDKILKIYKIYYVALTL